MLRALINGGQKRSLVLRALIHGGVIYPPVLRALKKTFKCFFINESGFYSLILSSKQPKAKEFKHWVTSKVLPSIRKYGYYDSKSKRLLIDTENDFKCGIFFCFFFSDEMEIICFFLILFLL